MKRRLAVLVAAATLTACIPAPPIPPPVVAIFKEIFHSTVPDPTGVHAPREPHSCAIRVYLADASLHAPYQPVDSYWYANGWAFWTACVIASRDLGYSIPVVKEDGRYLNAQVLDPRLTFFLDTAPVLGTGSGHYASFLATSRAAWAKAYIEAQG